MHMERRSSRSDGCFGDKARRLRSQLPQKCLQLAREELVPRVVGVQAVGHEPLPDALTLRLQTACGKQIQHRHPVPGGSLADEPTVPGQIGLIADAVSFCPSVP